MYFVISLGRALIEPGIKMDIIWSHIEIAYMKSEIPQCMANFGECVYENALKL